MMAPMLDDKEKKLIVELRKDGKRRINRIARDFGYPVSTIFLLWNRLQASGVLKHATKLSFERVGFPVKMLIAIKSDRSARQALQNFLATHKNVNTLHMVDSGFDFHIEAVFRNHKEAYDFIEELERSNKIIQQKAYYVIETIHAEKFLTDLSHFN